MQECQSFPSSPSPVFPLAFSCIWVAWLVKLIHKINLKSEPQVSAKSVKLLDEQELKDSDAREAWWVEIRQEVPSLYLSVPYCFAR